jgi:hypothetical protein
LVRFVPFCNTKSRQTPAAGPCRGEAKQRRTTGSNYPACRAESRNAGEGGRRAILWAFRAESAHEIDDKAYRQNQAKPAAADDGTAKVKPAAAEQEKKNNQE